MVARNYYQSCKGIHSSLHVYYYTLSDSEYVLDSVAYIECIIEAYSKYFVNDIEQTENIKQCQKFKLSLVLIT